MGIEDFGGESENEAMSEINVVPLTDVMLVLLIIFLITVPVVVETVPVKLPVVTNIPTTTKPENVPLSVDQSCHVYWGMRRLADLTQLREIGGNYLREQVEKQKAKGAAIELPEVHIRADADSDYKCTGGVIFAMQQAGYQRIGFISEPPVHATAG